MKLFNFSFQKFPYLRFWRRKALMIPIYWTATAGGSARIEGLFHIFIKEYHSLAQSDIESMARKQAIDQWMSEDIDSLYWIAGYPVKSK